MIFSKQSKPLPCNFDVTIRPGRYSAACWGRTFTVMLNKLTCSLLRYVCGGDWIV